MGTAEQSNGSCAIRLQDVSFCWEPSNPVLDIPELQINKGESVFIRGASGSGKSTLLSLVGGVLTPDQGEINLLGTTINRFSAAARDRFRAEHIGFIFQLFNLIPYLSVMENVILPCKFSPKRRDRLASQQLTPTQRATTLLQHLDINQDLIHRPVTQLSVGQQQRVAAARALIGSPEIVIADEPTSALDADRRAVFIDLLLQECASQQTTLVFVSHDPSLEPLFKRRIELDSINRAAKAVATS